MTVLQPASGFWQQKATVKFNIFGDFGWLDNRVPGIASQRPVAWAIDTMESGSLLTAMRSIISSAPNGKVSNNNVIPEINMEKLKMFIFFSSQKQRIRTNTKKLIFIFQISLIQCFFKTLI